MSIRCSGLVGAVVGLAVGGAGAQDAGVGGGLPTRNVAIVVCQGVELLDFAGPGEVFEVAGSAVRTSGGKPSFNVYTVSPNPGPIVSQGFVTVQPGYTIEGFVKIRASWPGWRGQLQGRTF